MKQWFEGLSQREQQLVMGAGILFAIGLFFQLILAPLNSSLENAQLKLKNKQELLTYVAENTAKFKVAKGAAKSSASGSLNQIVNSSARSSGISIARLQPQGDSLQVQVETVEFNKFLRWLNDLTQDKGLVIEALDISQNDQAGTVKVRRLQVTKI